MSVAPVWVAPVPLLGRFFKPSCGLSEHVRTESGNVYCERVWPDGQLGRESCVSVAPVWVAPVPLAWNRHGSLRLSEPSLATSTVSEYGQLCRESCVSVAPVWVAPVPLSSNRHSSLRLSELCLATSTVRRPSGDE